MVDFGFDIAESANENEDEDEDEDEDDGGFETESNDSDAAVETAVDAAVDIEAAPESDAYYV